MVSITAMSDIDNILKSMANVGNMKLSESINCICINVLRSILY